MTVQPKGILIVASSNLEMQRYSAAIAENKKDNKRLIDRVTYEQLQTLCRGKRNSGRYGEIYFLGHGRFHVQKGGEQIATKISEREIDAYSLEDITDIAIAAFLHFNIETLSFFSCESAVNKSTYHRDDKGRSSLVESFGLAQTVQIEQDIEEGNHEKISCIQYIAARIFRAMGDNYYTSEMRIVGMNGVGYINPENAQIEVFDIEHADTFKKIRHDLEKTSKKSSKEGKKELRELQGKEKALIQQHITNRLSAQQIELRVLVNMHEHLDAEADGDAEMDDYYCMAYTAEDAAACELFGGAWS